MVWNLYGNAKNAGNQGGNVENQGGNFNIAVEIIGKQWKWSIQRVGRSHNIRKLRHL